jgi:hypothetical protein
MSRKRIDRSVEWVMKKGGKSRFGSRKGNWKKPIVEYLEVDEGQQ